MLTTTRDHLDGALGCLSEAHDNLRKLGVAAKRQDADTDDFRDAFFDLLHAHAVIEDSINALLSARAYARAADADGKKVA